MNNIKEFILENKGLSLIVLIVVIVVIMVLYNMFSFENKDYAAPVQQDISSGSDVPSQSGFDVNSIVGDANIEQLRSREIEDLANKAESSQRTINNLTLQISSLEEKLSKLDSKLAESKNNSEAQNTALSQAKEAERQALLQNLEEMRKEIARLNKELQKNRKELNSRISEAESKIKEREANKNSSSANLTGPSAKGGSVSSASGQPDENLSLDSLLNFDEPALGSSAPSAQSSTEAFRNKKPAPTANAGASGLQEKGDKTPSQQSVNTELDSILDADITTGSSESAKQRPSQKKYNYYILKDDGFKKVTPMAAFRSYKEGVTVYRGTSPDTATPVTDIGQIYVPKKFYRVDKKTGALVEIADADELSRLFSAGEKIVTLDVQGVRPATADEIKNIHKEIDTSKYRVFYFDDKSKIKWVSDEEAQKLVVAGKVVNVKMPDDSIRSVSSLEELLLALNSVNSSFTAELFSGHVNAKAPRLFVEQEITVAADKPFMPGASGPGDNKPKLIEVTEEGAYKVLAKGKPVTVVFSDRSKGEEPVVIVTDAAELKAIMDNYRGMSDGSFTLGMFDGQLGDIEYKPIPTYSPSEDSERNKFKPVPTIPLASEVYARIDDAILAPLPPISFGTSGSGSSGAQQSQDLNYPVKITFIGDVVNDKNSGKISLDSCQAMGLASGVITQNPTFLSDAVARSKIIITSISCINENNEIIEQSFPAGSTGGIAYVVDTYDQQPGVHGYYYSDEDYRALESIPANVASEIGNAFATAGTTQTTVTGQPAQGTAGSTTIVATPTGGEVRRGIGAGVNKSLQDYIKMKADRANQIERVVYTPPGAIVKVIFNQSISLPGLVDEVNK